LNNRFRSNKHLTASGIKKAISHQNLHSKTSYIQKWTELKKDAKAEYAIRAVSGHLLYTEG
jgi:hypothetical protein